MLRNEIDIIKTLESLGIMVDHKTGHLSYSEKYSPLKLDYELVLIRHGETYGNCGQITKDRKIDDKAVQSNVKDNNKRIFQGDIDEEINQLTENGKLQALNAAYNLENELLARLWIPDIVFHSPLKRAKETALPFIHRNLMQNRFFSLPEVREMKFGSWENRRICDFPHNDPCHSFYRDQNALIKSKEHDSQGENFCELIIRAKDVLKELNRKYPQKKIIIYTHSMFAAACCILLGKGQMNSKGYLMFDGKKPNGESYTIPHAVPVLLNLKKA
jgi:broad specificity phosphatase PhoE